MIENDFVKAKTKESETIYYVDGLSGIFLRSLDNICDYFRRERLKKEKVNWKAIQKQHSTRKGRR